LFSPISLRQNILKRISFASLTIGRLEQWNNGKMGFGILRELYIGKTILTRCAGIIKNASILGLYGRFSIVPFFHHSLIPCAW